MANITSELSKITTAIYGEDVRWAIADALKKINTGLEEGGSGTQYDDTFIRQELVRLEGLIRNSGGGSGDGSSSGGGSYDDTHIRNELSRLEELIKGINTQPYDDTELRELIETNRKTLNDRINTTNDWTNYYLWRNRLVHNKKSLGSSVTPAQKTAIQNGNFWQNELLVGNYWEINNVIWRIADIDYFYGTGNSQTARLNQHHLVIIPDGILTNNVKMNDTATATGGYVNTKMRTTYINDAKEVVYKAFGKENILTYYDGLVSAIKNGNSYTTTLTKCDIEIPNEVMMYGHFHNTAVNDGTNASVMKQISTTQFALMRNDPSYIRATGFEGNTSIYYYWLRDIIDASGFAAVSYAREAIREDANSSNGVRPFFLLG